MTATSAGAYEQGGATLADKDAGGSLQAGYLENSNSDSARDMVGMTETVRHYESMQRVIQGYDEALQAAIRKLGEF